MGEIDARRLRAPGARLARTVTTQWGHRNENKSTIAAAAVLFTGLGASACLRAQQSSGAWATPWGGGPLLEYTAKGIAQEIEFLTNGEIKVEVVPGRHARQGAQSDRHRGARVSRRFSHNWAGYDWGVDRTGVLFGGFDGTMEHEKLIHWMFRGGGATC